MKDDPNISPTLLNSKPNPPILGLCTAQVMGFLVYFSYDNPFVELVEVGEIPELFEQVNYSFSLKKCCAPSLELHNFFTFNT